MVGACGLGPDAGRARISRDQGKVCRDGAWAQRKEWVPAHSGKSLGPHFERTGHLLGTLEC